MSQGSDLFDPASLIVAHDGTHAFEAVVPPIVQTSLFTFSSYDEMVATYRGEKSRPVYVQQIGAPLELYDRPANLFVAGFIGSPGMNFLEGRCVQKADGSAMVLPNGSEISLSQRVAVQDGEAMTLGIRPEHVIVTPETGGVEAQVELVEPTGLGIILHLTVHGLPFKLFSSNRALLQPGKSISVGLPQEKLHVFDRNGDRVEAELAQ